MDPINLSQIRKTTSDVYYNFNPVYLPFPENYNSSYDSDKELNNIFPNNAAPPDKRYPLHLLASENCMCMNENYYEERRLKNSACAAATALPTATLNYREDAMVCLCLVCSKHYGVTQCHGETCFKMAPHWDKDEDGNSLFDIDVSSLSDDLNFLRHDLYRKPDRYTASYSSDSCCEFDSGTERTYSTTNSPTVWQSSVQDELNLVCSKRNSPLASSTKSRNNNGSNNSLKTPVKRATKMKFTTRVQEKTAVTPSVPLRPSLFTDVPPTLSFFKSNEEVIPLPVEIRRLLIWKLSTITPVIIRQTVVRSGYQLTRKSTDWVAMWGKHMKSLQFQEMKDCQKVNHFPGSHNLGRKDNLLRHIKRARNLHGETEFNFLPETYNLPKDIRPFRKAWEKYMGTTNQLWIVKPPASARGTGIHLINKWNQVPKKQSAIVQKYIVNPYLINGSKFDLRIYVLVSSFNPLRIYIFDNGLVRFASVKYSHSFSSIENKFMHLTNYSINKNNASYTANDSENACEGHKWTLKALWGYLARRNVNVERLWEHIEDIVIKTIICAENGFNQLISTNVTSRYMCFELFGFDIMLDTNLRPWLLEVNISPSLHSSSQLDTAVKGQLVADMLNIVGFHIPDKLSAGTQYSLLQKLGLASKTRRLCLNRLYYYNSLSQEEKEKHDLFELNEEELDVMTVLDDLTSDDLRHLMQGEDELSRTGKFTRIFPSSGNIDYYKLLRVRRYYNVLQMAWELKYKGCRKAGILRLQTLCKKGLHLKGPKKISIGKEPAVHRETVIEVQEVKKEKNVKAVKSALKPVYKIPSKCKTHNSSNRNFSPGKKLVQLQRLINIKETNIVEE